MYYKHKANQMYNSRPLVFAFTISEYPFIALGAMIFVICFYFLVGFAINAGKFFFYYLFIFLATGLFTFMGQVCCDCMKSVGENINCTRISNFALVSLVNQMLMSVFRDSVTAQGFGNLTLGLTSLFSGLLIRPQNIPPFWYWGECFCTILRNEGNTLTRFYPCIIAYWMFPGHYILEGLLTTQFNNDDTLIEATYTSAFWQYLVDMGKCTDTDDEVVRSVMACNLRADCRCVDSRSSPC
jgi:ABC-2 type transporter